MYEIPDGLDGNVFKGEAQRLLPRAREYSAKFLDYFFAPSMTATVSYHQDPGQAGSWALNVTNTSKIGDQPMDFGPGTFSAFWFPADGGPWIEKAGHPVNFANGSSISSLSHNSSIKLDGASMELPSNYQYSTILLLVVFRGTIDGEEGRVAAYCVPVHIGFTDIRFTSVVFPSTDVTETYGAPAIWEQCYCKLNNYHLCTHRWVAQESWATSSLYYSYPSISGDIVGLSKGSISEIRVSPADGAVNTLWVNGVPSGTVWMKCDHPGIISQTLKISFDAIYTNSPKVTICNAGQEFQIKIPMLYYNQGFELFDRVWASPANQPGRSLDIGREGAPSVVGWYKGTSINRYEFKFASFGDAPISTPVDMAMYVDNTFFGNISPSSPGCYTGVKNVLCSDFLMPLVRSVYSSLVEKYESLYTSLGA